MSNVDRRAFSLPKDNSCPTPVSCKPMGFNQGCQEAVIVRQYPYLAIKSHCNHPDAIQARKMAEIMDDELE